MDQPGEDQRQHHQRGQQRQAEHRVAGQQQRLAPLPRGEVGHQQRALGGRHHRGHQRQQPDRRRGPRRGTVAYDHQVRDRDRGHQADQRARDVQHDVRGERRPRAHHVRADRQGGAADRRQSHRQAAVERGDRRVQQMGAGLVAVVEPVPGPRGENGQEEDRRERPHEDERRPRPGSVHGQPRPGGGDDRGAHDTGVPVRADVPQRRQPDGRAGSLGGRGLRGPRLRRPVIHRAVRSRPVRCPPVRRRGGLCGAGRWGGGAGLRKDGHATILRVRAPPHQGPHPYEVIS